MGNDKHIHVYLELVDNLIEQFGTDFSSLPKHRQERIETYKREEDRLRCLAVSHLYVYAMKKQGLDPDMPVYFNEMGKMYLGDKGSSDTSDKTVGSPDGKSNDLSYYVNLSHGGSYVVCAIADCEVGVDVEGSRKCSESVLRRFLRDTVSESDRQRIASILSMEEGSEKDQEFTLLWTQKESQVKLDGRGIGVMHTLSTDHMKTVSFHMEDYNLSVSCYSQDEPQISLHRLTQ